MERTLDSHHSWLDINQESQYEHIDFSFIADKDTLSNLRGNYIAVYCMAFTFMIEKLFLWLNVWLIGLEMPI